MKLRTTPKIVLLGLSVLIACAVYGQQTQKKRSNKKSEEKSTKFTPPIISADTANVYNCPQISVMDVRGADDDRGIDIEDLKECKVIVEERKDRPFVTVEQMPRFEGGEEKMMQFIADTLHYPVVAQEAGIQGRVVVRFVVDKEGKVTDPTVIRGIDPSCDKEAVRIVKLMPKWTPGKQNGQNVAVYYTLPIVFRLK